LHKGILFQIMSLMLFLAFLTLLHSISPVRSEGNLLVVSNDELADFQTIQEAVNAAASGDQIYVKAGIYFEHVMVNKTVFLIGENPSNTVIDGSNNGDAVTVTADNVSMTQLTLQNGYCGVTATEAHGMICTNNVVKNNIFGIYLRQCSTISFADNLIEHNQHGIWFVHLRQCYMRRNNFMSNSFNFEPEVIDIDYYALEEYVHDIDMSNSVDGKPIYYIVNEQDIEVPSNAGFVAIVNSSQIVAENLNLRNNAMGVFLVNTNDSLIRNVRVGDSENAGIALTHSERNLILNNVIDNCSWGIVPWEWTVDNTISNNTLRGNDFFGVVLHGSECIRNRVSDNFFVDNSFGVHLGGDCYYNIVERNLLENNTIGLSTDLNRENTFRENTVVGSDRGFYLYYTQDNCIYRNNFINNREQVFVQEFAKDSWDNGYEGNYWSDYIGVDADSDGIGDSSYTIDASNNDRYPLMGVFNPFCAGTWSNVTYYVDIISNSTISGFTFNVCDKMVSFNVTGSSSSAGFCRVTVPDALLSGPYKVWIGTTQSEPITISNGTCNSFYFTYNHSIQNVTIRGTEAIPELAANMALSFILLTMSIFIFSKKMISREFRSRPCHEKQR